MSNDDLKRELMAFTIDMKLTLGYAMTRGFSDYIDRHTVKAWIESLEEILGEGKLEVEFKEKTCSKNCMFLEEKGRCALFSCEVLSCEVDYPKMFNRCEDCLSFFE